MTTKQKRLDQIESQLTPKEWAIKLADELRKHPSQADFHASIAKGSSYRDNPVSKPFWALAKQAEKLHSGFSRDDGLARAQLSRKLRGEYHALKRLIFDANEKTRSKAEVAGLKAALKLTTLQTVILQDAFDRTSRKAAGWIEEYKTADAADEDQRQVMLKELAAYGDAYLGETFADSLPLGPDIRLRFPSLIEGWVQDTAILIMDVFRHEAALRIIQDKNFDGHSILFRDVETELAETIKTVEGGVATFNNYLKTRAELFKAEWDADEQEDGIAGAIPGEREGLLTIDIETIKGRARHQGATFADEWMKNNRDMAVSDILEETGEHETHCWNRFREAALGGQETEVKP